MEIKNNQITIIESSLNELNKIIYDKDSKILQLQKDKEYLKDSIANSRYEYETIIEENKKALKQIKTLSETKSLLKKEIQEKIIEIKSLENSKREEIKFIEIKTNSSIKIMEEKLLESNEFEEELKSKNEYLQNIIEVNKNEEELLKYDNYNLKKQIITLKETIEEEKKVKRYEYNEKIDSSIHKNNDIQGPSVKEQEELLISNENLKKQVQILRQSIKDEKAKRFDQEVKFKSETESKVKDLEDSKMIEINKKLDNFEKKFQDSKTFTTKEDILKEEEQLILSEEDILKNNLGL